MTYGVYKTTPPLLAIPAEIAGIAEGGTGADNVVDACENLAAISRHFAGENGRAIPLSVSKKILPEHLFETALYVTKPTLLGPSKAYSSQKTIFWITNYSDFNDYSVTCDFGTVSQVKNKIYYDVPVTGTDAGFVLNCVSDGASSSVTVSIEIDPFIVNAPVFTGPINNVVDTLPIVAITVEPMSCSPGYVDYQESMDWQLSLSSNFSSLVASSIGLKTDLTRWLLSDLLLGTGYYVRCRFKSARYGYSDWSPVLHFTTIAALAGEKPSILYPVEGDEGISYNVTVTSSKYYSIGYGTHISTSWQFSTNSNFSTIFHESLNDAGHKLSYPVTGLTNSTLFYVRVQYHDDLGNTTEWSTPVSFTTAAINAVLKPSITSPITDSTVPLTFTVTMSAFAVSGGSDTHESTDWLLYDLADPNTVLQSFLADTVNKTSREFVVPSFKKSYRIKARYNGASGFVSPYCTPITVKTYRINKPTIENMEGTSSSGFFKFEVPWMTVTGGSDTALRLKVRYYSNPADIVGSMISFYDIEILNINVVLSNTFGDGEIITIDPNNRISIAAMHIASFDTNYYVDVLYEGTNYSDSGWSDRVVINIPTYVPPPEPIDNTPSISNLFKGSNDWVPYLNQGQFRWMYAEATEFVAVTPGEYLLHVEFVFTQTTGPVQLPAITATEKVIWAQRGICTALPPQIKLTEDWYVRVRYYGSSSGWTDYSAPDHIYVGHIANYTQNWVDVGAVVDNS